MAIIQGFRELHVYQEAFAAAMRVFTLTSSFRTKNVMRWWIRCVALPDRCALTSQRHGANDATRRTSLAN